jgi:glutamine amidotransferase
MITIVNYGLGNIKAFANVYKRLNIPVVIAENSQILRKATKIILPGVGSFDHAMTQLNNSGLRDVLDELVINNKIPVLGICVGMQILANYSEEGVLPGLGWIDGVVKKINPSISNEKFILPHMGWNTIEPKSQDGLMSKLSVNSRFYFLHSYYFQCARKEDVIATSDYKIKFTCAVKNRNIFGVQFHPEKSHSNGIQLLKNFATL